MTEEWAASGTLLKHAMVQLMETQALSENGWDQLWWPVEFGGLWFVQIMF